MTRILIAVDGSDLDHVSVTTAHRLFGDDAQYLAVNVSDEPTPRTAYVSVPYGFVYPYHEEVSTSPDSAGNPVHRAEDVARRAAEEAGLENVEVIGEVGDAAEVIVAAAARNGCDVIVVGSHDRGWLSRLVHPSVSGEVVHTSTIPVLVVKPPEA